MGALSGCLFAPDSTLTFVFLYMPIELPGRDSEVAKLGVIGGLHPAVPPALCGETGGLAGKCSPSGARPVDKTSAHRNHRFHLRLETPPGSTQWPAPRAAHRWPRATLEPGPWLHARLPLFCSPASARLTGHDPETTTPVMPRDCDLRAPEWTRWNYGSRDAPRL